MRTCLYPNCPTLVKSGYCEKHKNRLRYCSFPGCPNKVTEGNYCQEHAPNKRCDIRRGSSSSRGYTFDWSKCSKQYLATHPLCEMCEKEGRTTPAVMVHHVKPLREGGERLNWNNLQALCEACHRKAHKRLNDEKPH